MYLYSRSEGENFFQVDHEPLPEDIKSVSDGCAILKVDKNGHFKQMQPDGSFKIVPLGFIAEDKEEKIKWTTSNNLKNNDECLHYNQPVSGEYCNDCHKVLKPKEDSL